MMWLAGILGGALMGMIFVAHLSAMFALRPPAVLRDRSPESTLVPLVTLTSMLSMLIWQGLGVAAAATFSAVHARLTISAPGTPSVVYSAGVVGLALLLLPLLLLFVRGRFAHVAAELALFAGIFGWLVPLLISAR